MPQAPNPEGYFREEDREIKESYEDYVKMREEEMKTTPRSMITNISPRVIIGFGIVVLFMMYLTFVQKVIEQSTFFWFVIALLVIFIILSAQGEGKKRELIPEPQLKAILYQKLKDKQRVSPTEVPNGEVRILLPCKLKKIEGVPIKYVFSFKVITPSGLERLYTAEMNPYDGYLFGFEERLFGFRGTEVTDVSFIRRKEDIWDQKYFRYKKPGGGAGGQQ